MGSMSMTGNYRLRLTVTVVATILVLWGLVSCLRSEEERIADRVHEAREALVDGRTDDFLAYFADDVVYQRTKGKTELAADAVRWKEIQGLKVGLPDVRVTIDGDQAVVNTNAIVGPSILQSTSVAVELGLRRDGKAWSVERFDWSR